MDGVGKAFADDTPLEGEVTVVIECGAFVRAPTHGAVVDDDILMRFCSVHGIVTFLLDVNSHTRTDKTDNHVVRLDGECIVLQTYTIARCCLTGNSQVQ